MLTVNNVRLMSFAASGVALWIFNALSVAPELATRQAAATPAAATPRGVSIVDRPTREPAALPAVAIPPEWRMRNWSDRAGAGSCVHACLISLFRWQGQPELAERWRARYAGGEYPERLAERLEREGVRWAATTGAGDVAFLEWACNTRRGCGVTVQGGAHMVCLVHLDAKRAGILDPNQPGRILWRSRESFLREWLATSQRWAVTPVYATPPRRTWRG